MCENDVSAEAREWFLSAVLPRVKHRCRGYWQFGPEADLEEYQAEAIGIAWRRLVRHWRKVPLTKGAAVLLSRRSAADAMRGIRIAGRAKSRDVIDGPERRTTDRPDHDRRETNIDLLASAPDTRHAPPADLAVLRVDWQTFSRTLCPTERRAADLLSTGRYVYEVARMIGVCDETLANWRREWWRAWSTLNPDTAHFRFVLPGNRRDRGRI